MELINNIYEEMISTILQGFNDSEFGEVTASYREYLIKNYGNKQGDIDKLKAAILSIERDKWKDKDKKNKQMNLFNDVYLERLGYLSNLALKLAKGRFYGNEDNAISTDEVLEYIKLMKEYASLVREFNRGIADVYLSEGILDFQYAIGLSNNMSLRLGH